VDTEFTGTGTTTRIDYLAGFEHYKTLAEKMLEYPAGQETYAMWNAYVFDGKATPHTHIDQTAQRDEFGDAINEIDAMLADDAALDDGK